MRIKEFMNPRQFIGFVIIVSLGLGSYYYFEDRNEHILLNIPTHGEHVVLFVGDTELQIEVVGTDEAMERGLSGRETLSESNAESSGMFFLFSRNDFHGIWMKDMLFPIDIVWINENLRIITIVKGATPESFPQIFKPTQTSRYVLEVSSNLTTERGIKIGDKIRFENLD